MTDTVVRPEIRAVVAEHGGWEAFLDWCDTTTTDALSTFDITDEEWAALHVENRDPFGRCAAYTGPDECSWCDGSWRNQ